MSTKINPVHSDGSAIAPVVPNELENVRAVPEFLRALSADDTSTALLKSYVVPPRLKMIQPTSRPPFSDRFQQGELVMLPIMQPVAKFSDGKSHAFTFTPLFFFPEWLIMNPLETKGTLKAVRERTFESRSEIAIKAKNPKLRKSEPCPECPEKDGKKLYLNYLECLNYIIWIHGDKPFCEVPIALTFTSGEHFAGMSFNALINTRRAALWGCNFQAVIRRRTNEKGSWFGIDCENPSFESGVPAWTDRAAEMKIFFEEFKKTYEDKLLQVDYDDESLEGNIESLKDAKDM
jgi:hypothetical protein